MDTPESMGWIADRAGDAAYELGGQTQPYTGGRKRWTRQDSDSLDATLIFEHTVLEAGLAPYADPIERTKLVRDHAALRDALPFSAGEWKKLIDISVTHPLHVGYVAVIRGAIRSEVIIEDGIERPISGRELMQRWWTWRRGLDQFADLNGSMKASEKLFALEKRLRAVGAS